jgi:uncharacterized protein YprB with RNaseH-like and TPR domain
MSKSDDLRKRLEALNRGPLAPRGDGPGDAEELRGGMRKGLRGRRSPPGDDRSKPPPAAGKPSPAPIVFRRDLPRYEPAGSPVLSAIGPHVSLDEAAGGGEAVAPDGSRAYLVDRPVAEQDGPAAKLCQALADAVSRSASGLWAQVGRMVAPGELRVEDLIFLDLETTGLGSSPLFLIGAMVWDAGGLLARQYFARDYSEERAAVGCFMRLAEGRKLLVSFNGKSFDLPFLRMRAAANGLVCGFDPAHLDLLHAARRVWRHRVPDCRLQTLERLVCGRTRADDIPGHLIPDAYHEYVRTGNAARMVNVLEHNFLDLLTLVDLLVRLPGSVNR